MKTLLKDLMWITILFVMLLVIVDIIGANL